MKRANPEMDVKVGSKLTLDNCQPDSYRTVLITYRTRGVEIELLARGVETDYR